MYSLCLKNMLYYLPHYMQAITFNEARYHDSVVQDEDEDFEMEFQSLIV